MPPPYHTLPPPILTHHYNLLPGIPNDNSPITTPRLYHDIFNIITLPPLILINMLNWKRGVWWDLYTLLFREESEGGIIMGVEKKMMMNWEGRWYVVGWWGYYVYFLVDFGVIWSFPGCVKSPKTILQHHILTLFYMLIQYSIQLHPWLYSLAISVEFNTFLLILRRVLHTPKRTLASFTLSILISTSFYLSWIFTRCIVCPYMMIPIWEFSKECRIVGWLCMVIQGVFCGLNFRWTVQLGRSKLRSLRLGGKEKEEKYL